MKATLSARFEALERQVVMLESAPKEVPALIEALTQLRLQVDQLSFFSNNETVEDIPTRAIQFLLLPAYLALAHLQARPEDRPMALQQALTLATAFLAQLELYKVPLLEWKQESGSDARRQQKIWYHKEKKRLAQAMAWLKTSATNAEDGDGGVDADGDGDADVDVYEVEVEVEV